jgi:predicted nucleic acid-binding protein
VNLLDTDALSHLQKSDSVGLALASRLAASADPDFRITTVSAYEMLGGAIDLIRQLRKKHRDLVPGFRLLYELLDYLRGWQGRVIQYDAEGDRIYRGIPSALRQQLGNDARIAAIALAHGAAVWTCNVADYRQVPSLTVYAAVTGMPVSTTPPTAAGSS